MESGLQTGDSVLSTRVCRLIALPVANEDGCSLVEAIVAVGLMAGALASLGQMLAISIASNHSARAGSDAVVLAQQKMEQLRGLTWGFDVSGLPISDTTTDTAAPVETGTGTGLSLSPEHTLTSNTPGWVDYVDESGVARGGGSEAPAGAAFLRRWAIEALPSNPTDAIVIRVLVKPTGRYDGSARASPARQPGEVHLINIKTRKAR